MRALVLLVVSLSVACGPTEGESLAKLSWQFDYADPTDDTQSPDVRGCDNARANNPGPAYPPIDIVRVALVDPEGQVQGIDIDYQCELGYRGERIGLQGVVQQTYELTIEAKSADGTVLYRHFDDEFDLSAYREDDFTLRTVTGEIHFFPDFAGSLTCPGNVASFRTTLYRKENGTVPDSPTRTVMHEPACDAGLSNEVFVRALPIQFENPLQTFNDYKLVVEALDAGGSTLHCGVNPARVIRLGDNSSTSNETLTPGACP